MTPVHAAVTKKATPTAGPAPSGFSGRPIKSITLGGLQAKQLKLAPYVQAALDRSGALASGDPRGTWFMADWFEGGSYKFDPKALKATLSKDASAKQLMADVMMAVNSTTAADEGLSIDENFSLKRIAPNAIMPAIFKETLQTKANIKAEGYTDADIAKMKPAIDAYRSDLLDLVRNQGRGTQKIFLAEWNNGDDTYYSTYVAVNAKTGELHVLEDGTTG